MAGLAMKFWQLASITREQPGLLSKVASQREAWKRYGENATNFDLLVNEQDRQILDEMVDPEFAAAVLSDVRISLYIGGGRLGAGPLDSARKISALEAVSRFGGDAVEDALEYGSVAIDQQSG